MPDASISKTVTVVNSQGLHMRPAYLLAQKAAQFESTIEVVLDQRRVDGKSVLSILTLGAVQGSEVSVEGQGSDAQAAVDAIAELIEAGFPDPDAAPETAAERNLEADPDVTTS